MRVFYLKKLGLQLNIGNNCPLPRKKEANTCNRLLSGSLADSPFLMITAVFLRTVITGVYLLIAELGVSSKEKNSAYECGFDPSKRARLPFSFRFFLLAILFVVFDVEIALLFPFIQLGGRVFLCWGIRLFLWVLTLGLFHEWRHGVLDWVR